MTPLSCQSGARHLHRHMHDTYRDTSEDTGRVAPETLESH